MAFDYSWLIGGPQGSGVDTAANIFSRVGAKLGYHVFGKREYHSNIKGLHSYFVVRLSDKKIRSNTNGANIMVAYDAETLVRHGLEIIKDGAIIYDASIVNTTVDQIPTLEASHKARLPKLLILKIWSQMFQAYLIWQRRMVLRFIQSHLGIYYQILQTN